MEGVVVGSLPGQWYAVVKYEKPTQRERERGKGESESRGEPTSLNFTGLMPP